MSRLTAKQVECLRAMRGGGLLYRSYSTRLSWPGCWISRPGLPDMDVATRTVTALTDRGLLKRPHQRVLARDFEQYVLTDLGRSLPLVFKEPT